jgi:formate-dependent nitrite reductase membrane component NrfD
MNNVFNMGSRTQQEWSWLLAIWLFLGGTGSGLFLLYVAFALSTAYAVLSLALIMVGGGVLLLELGNPLRLWRTIFRANTSWLSRGVIFVFLFLGSWILSVGPKIEILSFLAPLDGNLSSQIFGWIGGLSALMIVLYPAFFFLSTSRAIPFWNTPLLPLLFVGHAILGGAGAVLLLAPYLNVPPQIEFLAIALIVINAAMTLLYLVTMHRADGSARESVRLLNRPPLSLTFWIGVVAMGMILPLLEILVIRFSITAAGAFILLGGLSFRYCLLRAGVYVPPALVASDLDLSKLNRTSSEFEREYGGMGARRAGQSG